MQYHFLGMTNKKALLDCNQSHLVLPLSLPSYWVARPRHHWPTGSHSSLSSYPLRRRRPTPVTIWPIGGPTTANGRPSRAGGGPGADTRARQRESSVFWGTYCFPLPSLLQSLSLLLLLLINTTPVDASTATKYMKAFCFSRLMTRTIYSRILFGSFLISYSSTISTIFILFGMFYTLYLI